MPSAGLSMVVGLIEMLCTVDSKVKSCRPAMNGSLLSCPCLLKLDVFEALDEALDVALGDAHEDTLDHALDEDMLSRASCHEFAYI